MTQGGQILTSPRFGDLPKDTDGGGSSCSHVEASDLPPPLHDTPVSGLQVVALNERARLLRFLAARGAGADAEDLFQELWQRAARTPAQPIADPLSYLFRTAENLMRDVRRAQTSRERRQFEWHETASTAEEHPLGERVLIARERLEIVNQVLEQLGPRAASVFRLYRLEGKSQSLIARDFGISLSSVEKDLQKAYRALAQLKAKFDAE